MPKYANNVTLGHTDTMTPHPSTKTLCMAWTEWRREWGEDWRGWRERWRDREKEGGWKVCKGDWREDWRGWRERGERKKYISIYLYLYL